MSNHLDWYFDYISPFAYLQHAQFHQLPADTHIRYQPVLLAGLLNYWQSKGPAEIPSKRTFTYQYVRWFADTHKIKLKFPPAHPFNPLPLLRLTFALDCDQDVVNTIFHYVWVEGRSVDDPESWKTLLKRLNVQDAEQLIQSTNCKQQLIDNTTRATEQGVFGVPSFVIDQRLFWGSDSIGFLTDYLNNPQVLNTDAMRALETLPVSAKRRH